MYFVRRDVDSTSCYILSVTITRGAELFEIYG